MKKTIAIFLSALLICSTLASCASDPNASHTKKGVEIGAGTGAGTGAVGGAGVGAMAGGIVGGALGVMCSILTLGLGTVPCMATGVGGGMAVGAGVGAGTGAVMDHNEEKDATLP